MALINGKQIKDASVALAKIASAAIVIESEGISSNDNDTTLPTSAAVKDYVDSQVVNSGSMSNFVISDGTNTQTVEHSNTVTFAGTTNEVEVTVSATDTVTIGLPNDVVVAGNLTVNGTTTTINSTTLSVDYKNIELGSVSTPSDTTADGGGITLKGATDKTFNWMDATDAWTSSEHIDLVSGKVLKIATTEVLSADGAAKVQSSVAATNGGLSHSSGALSSKGLTEDIINVGLAITSGGTITTKPSAYVGKIILALNGIRQVENTDWAISSNNIVWSDSNIDLESGDVVTLTYHAG